MGAQPQEWLKCFQTVPARDASAGSLLL